MDAPTQRLSVLVNTAINDDIPDQVLDNALSTPPFVAVPGTFNTRDLGHPPYLRQGLVYRSGTMNGVTREGKHTLTKTLKVYNIFDLRSASERQSFPTQYLEEGDNAVRVRWQPADSAPTGMNIADYVSLNTDADLWDGGSRGYSKQYQEILDIYKNAFQEVFRHLHDCPGAPILFNCTAGKDRTGVLAALILSLTGVPDEDIAFDYSLTRVGIEPQKEFLRGMIKRWKPNWTDATPGMLQFSNVRREYMKTFLRDARTKYDETEAQPNWAETYLRNELGFEMEEVQTIRRNLRPQTSDD